MTTYVVEEQQVVFLNKVWDLCNITGPDRAGRYSAVLDQHVNVVRVQADPTTLDTAINATLAAEQAR